MDEKFPNTYDGIEVVPCRECGRDPIAIRFPGRNTSDGVMFRCDNGTCKSRTYATGATIVGAAKMWNQSQEEPDHAD